MTPPTILAERLRERSATLTERWLDACLAAYAPATRAFYRGEASALANPAGQGLARAAARVLEAFIGGGDLAAAAEPLGHMMQIRLVTTEDAAAAAGFVFALRGLVLDELGQAGAEPTRQELDVLHARVDALALMAFDAYAEGLRRLHEVRIRELSRAGAARERLAAWRDQRAATGAGVGQIPSADGAER
jgi:hypothetical protein